MKFSTKTLCFVVTVFFSLLSFTTVQAGSITGTVVDDATGDPLVGVWVFAYDAYDQETVLAGSQTITGGKYTLDKKFTDGTPLPSGKYKLQYDHIGYDYIKQWYQGKLIFNDAAIVELTSANPDAALDTVRLVKATAQIRGKITDAVTGDGIPDARVKVYINTTNSWVKTSNLTIDDGEYVVSGLAADTYRVFFNASQTDKYVSKDYSAPVTLAAGEDKPGIDAELSSGGSIGGAIYNSAETALPDALVKVFDSKSKELKGFATTKTGGVYTVNGLALPGSYIVQFYEKNDGTGLSEWYDNQPDSDSAAANSLLSIDETTSSHTEIDATLDHGDISGRITNKEAGAPVANVSVKIYSNTFTLSGSATTGTDGKYTVPFLPVGSYRVQFASKSWYDGQESFDTADPVDAGSFGIDWSFEPSVSNSLLPVYKLLLLKPRPQSENP
jgi:5-hydroxyisourate hydrolase-like protein (transthyretin family)